MAAAECIAGNLRLHFRRMQRHHSAVTIQCAARVFMAKQLVMLERRRKLEWNSATAIQRAYQCHLVREMFLDIRASVIQLQAVIRGFLVCRRGLPRVDEETPAVDEEVDKEVVVAVTDEEEPVEHPLLSPAFQLGSVEEMLLLPPPTLPSPPRRNIAQLPKLVSSPKVDLNKQPTPAPAAKQRQRRKTIAVSLSPMPYKTVLVQQSESGDISMNQKHHDDLRRKLLERKEQERQKERDRQKKQAEIESEEAERQAMEKEERRDRLIIKLARKRKLSMAKKKSVDERQAKEIAAMEREERVSRIAWKILARREAEKLAKKQQRSVAEIAPPKKLYIRQSKPKAAKKIQLRKTSSNQCEETSQATQFLVTNSRDEDDWGYEFDELVEENELSGLIVT
ncbi:unnamed protein product [Aphanomyces euteiches]